MRIRILIPSLLLCVASAAQGQELEPNEFNVYSLSTIDYSPNGSDVEGIVGCGGSFHAESFGLHTGAAAGPLTGVSLYAGGTVTLGTANGGTQTNNGGVEAAGNVQVTSSAVFGDIRTGGACSLTNGQIHGDVTCGGLFSGNELDVSGVVLEGAPFQPVVNLGWYSTYYLGQADAYSYAAPNATWSVNGGRLDIQLHEQISSITVPASMIKDLHTIAVDGPLLAQLSVIATGNSFDFNSITWLFTGGVDAQGIAIICSGAVAGRLKGGTHLTLIAPRANVNFENGFLIGNLIVGALSGSGQVHYGPWRGFTKGNPGVAYCYGDPTVDTPCPCGNDNDGSVPGSGCANGVFSSGALMIANGVPSVSEDSLFLATSGVQPNTFGVYYQNDDSLAPGIHWGDGLMCSTTNLKRLGPVYSSAAGYSDTSSLPVAISVKGQALPGDTKYYGYWYRSWWNSPCGFDFNTSNAYMIEWLP
jgi:choice-of-anchor A domain-containing protein